MGGGQWRTCAMRAQLEVPVPHQRANLGLESIVSLEYVSIRQALRDVSRMHAGQVGASKRSPSLPLQCRQCRSRGGPWHPTCNWGVGFCEVVPCTHVYICLSRNNYVSVFGARPGPAAVFGRRGLLPIFFFLLLRPSGCVRSEETVLVS